MSGKFELTIAKNGEVYFRLKAANGETILKSEMYTSRAAALSGIESVRTNAPDDARYERKASAIGQFMFNLRAANHQVIGTSESYTSEAGRERGIASVKANAPGASIVDQT